MHPHPHPTTIDPVRRERIDLAVSSSEDAVAAGRQIRKFSDQATVKLARAVRQATGVLGTDLLADRDGRIPNQQGQKS